MGLYLENGVALLVGICWRENKNKLEKDAFFPVFSRAWDKEKILSPHEELNRIPRSDALPLSHRNSTVSEVNHEVHMTRVLSTARISNVNRILDRSLSSVKIQRKMLFLRPTHATWRKNKHIFLHLYRAQNLPSLSFYLRKLLSKKWWLMPWGLRVPIWKIYLCSRVLRLSELPRCRERQQSPICCWKWLGRLKCLATGLDASLSFPSTSRRCSRARKVISDLNRRLQTWYFL